MSFEIIGKSRLHWPIRHVVFDWDGTLSLIRSGWADLLADLFLKHLASEDRAGVLDAIFRLNGHPTARQVGWLIDELKIRGRPAADPAVYLEEFAARLQTKIDERLAGDRGPLLVYDARLMLDTLRERGLKLHVATGTDEAAVRREAELLGLADYFEGRIHGAPKDGGPFSKLHVLETILREHDAPGEALMVFGDGEVEIRAARAFGGLAVAVANQEADNGSGLIDFGKWQRLIDAGAHAVIPDYRDTMPLLMLLLPK